MRRVVRATVGSLYRAGRSYEQTRVNRHLSWTSPATVTIQTISRIPTASPRGAPI